MFDIPPEFKITFTFKPSQHTSVYYIDVYFIIIKSK